MANETQTMTLKANEMLEKKKYDIDITSINDSDKPKYIELAKSLVVTDINSISNYGSELQNVMGRYSTEFLNTVRAPQSGEVGLLINQLLDELGYINVDELGNKSSIKKYISKLPIIGKLVNNVTKILKKYDTIANNVDEISKKIAASRLASLRDNNTLQTMFDNNIAYGKQLDELIIAGKLKLEEIKSSISEMEKNPDIEAHQIQDAQEFVNNLERRLDDMLVLRYVIKQSLPQIRTVQYNNIALADKAQSIIATTIPVWKNQLSIAVALQHQKERIDCHRKISDTTNAILRKNAELLKQNSIDVAKENERRVIDIETLRDTTRNLIETIQEVKRIHEEASAQRLAAETEIMKIEKELENTMVLPSNTHKSIAYSASN